MIAPSVQIAAFRDVITIEVVPAAPAPQLRISGARVYDGAPSEALPDEVVRAIVGEAVKAMLLQAGRASAALPRLAVAR